MAGKDGRPGLGDVLRALLAKLAISLGAAAFALGLVILAMQGIGLHEKGIWIPHPVGSLVEMPTSGFIPLQAALDWIGGKPASLLMLGVGGLLLWLGVAIGRHPP